MNQNIHSLLYKNLKKVIMTIKQLDIVFIVTIKYYMNKKFMKNKNFQKTIWHHLYYHIVKK
jgi:hypothetical protein